MIIAVRLQRHALNIIQIWSLTWNCAVFTLSTRISPSCLGRFFISSSALEPEVKISLRFLIYHLTFCRKQDKFSTFIWKIICRAAIEVSGTMTLESDRYLMVTFKDRNIHISVFSIVWIFVLWQLCKKTPRQWRSAHLTTGRLLCFNILHQNTLYMFASAM